MSWSINFIGNPEKLVSALEEYSTKIDGKSKEEYDAALPHMVGLVKQNYNKAYPPVLRINASGHGYTDYNNCMVEIKNLGGQLV